MDNMNEEEPKHVYLAFMELCEEKVYCKVWRSEAQYHSTRRSPRGREINNCQAYTNEGESKTYSSDDVMRAVPCGMKGWVIPKHYKNGCIVEGFVFNQMDIPGLIIAFKFAARGTYKRYREIWPENGKKIEAQVDAYEWDGMIEEIKKPEYEDCEDYGESNELQFLEPGERMEDDFDYERHEDEDSTDPYVPWRTKLIKDGEEPIDECVRCHEFLRPENRKRGLWLDKHEEFWMHESCFWRTRDEGDRAIGDHHLGDFLRHVLLALSGAFEESKFYERARSVAHARYVKGLSVMDEKVFEEQFDWAFRGAVTDVHGDACAEDWMHRYKGEPYVPTVPDEDYHDSGWAEYLCPPKP